MAMFDDVRVGDKLWSIHRGDCEVVSVDIENGCLEVVDVKGHCEEYYIDGRWGIIDAFPSLFWSKPEIVIPEKPKRLVEKEVTVWCNVSHAGSPMDCYDTEDMAKRQADKFTSDVIATVKCTGTYMAKE